jgi:hypothetical protein
MGFCIEPTFRSSDTTHHREDQQMKAATLIAGVLLATPVLAAEQLTDAQLDRITAGGFTVVDARGRLGLTTHPGPANIGIFVNGNGQAGTLVGTLSTALAAGGFTIVDTRRRLGVTARPGPANIGIFVNDNGQAGMLIDTLRVALTAAGFTLVDTRGRLGLRAHPGPANIGIFLNDNGQAGMLINTSGQSLR